MSSINSWHASSKQAIGHSAEDASEINLDSRSSFGICMCCEWTVRYHRYPEVYIPRKATLNYSLGQLKGYYRNIIRQNE